MSEIERNKGMLIPTNIDLENYTEDDLETLYENGMTVIAGEVYSIEWEVKKQTDDICFADVRVNEDWSISFHTLHDSGCSFEEVIEDALK